MILGNPKIHLFKIRFYDLLVKKMIFPKSFTKYSDLEFVISAKDYEKIYPVIHSMPFVCAEFFATDKSIWKGY